MKLFTTTPGRTALVAAAIAAMFGSMLVAGPGNAAESRHGYGNRSHPNGDDRLRHPSVRERCACLADHRTMPPVVTETTR